MRPGGMRQAVIRRRASRCLAVIWVILGAVGGLFGEHQAAAQRRDSGPSCDTLAAGEREFRRADAGELIDYERMMLIDAVRECRVAIEQEPRNLRYRVQLGRTLLLTGEPAEALQHLLEVANQGFADGQFWLGALGLDGRFGPLLGRQESVGWLREAADRGHPRAQARIGDILNDQGDTDAALTLYLRAARQDDIRAAISAARLYETMGERIQALVWYRRAADTGDVVAQAALGRLSDAAGNREDALAWYRRAVDGGNAEAMYEAALIFDDMGDAGMATALHSLAAEAGIVFSQATIGFMLLDGEFGSDADTTARGMDLLERAAGSDDAFGQWALAKALLEMGSDTERAIDLMGASAAAGFPGAHFGMTSILVQLQDEEAAIDAACAFVASDGKFGGLRYYDSEAVVPLIQKTLSGGGYRLDCD